MDDTSTILARIVRLERERRLWRAAGLGLVLVAACGLLSARPGSRVLEAERLRILDAAGHLAIEIDAGALVLHGAPDADGRRLTARLAPGLLEPAEARDDAPGHLVELRPQELDLVDYTRERRAVVTAARLGLQHGIETPPVAWIATLGDTGLELRARDGTRRAVLGIQETPPADVGLSLHDAQGSLVWSAP